LNEPLHRHGPQPTCDAVEQAAVKGLALPRLLPQLALQLLQGRSARRLVPCYVWSGRPAGAARLQLLQLCHILHTPHTRMVFTVIGSIAYPPVGDMQWTPLHLRWGEEGLQARRLDA
jgi:hypothetical protein